MALFQAIGLGVAIVVLRVLAPEVWNALQHLTIGLLTFGGELVDHLQAAAAVIVWPSPAL